VSELLVAPGNAGTAGIAENVAVPASDVDSLVQLASERRVDLGVVGPEIPLALGLVDRLQGGQHPTFGPTREAARLSPA
jgi:phosphoribosylamine--glycine ligase